MEFPVTRLRRLRRTEAMRSLVREVHLHPGALIYPLFICPGEGVRREVSSMPGVYNLSIDEAMKEVEEAAKLGLAGLLLFGIPAVKDEEASGAWADDGIVQQALRAFKPAAKKLLLIADVCVCEYTSHGHCGVVRKNGDELRSRERCQRQPAGPDRGLVGRSRRGRRCAFGHDGWPRGCDSRPSRRCWPPAGADSVAMRPSLPLPSTGLSAKLPAPRRSSATGAPTRWMARTCARPCERSIRILRKART